MDLLSYISDRGRRRALAEATGKSPDYIWQIATGRRRASTDLAQAIERFTTAQGPETVLRSSLRPDVWAPDREVASSPSAKSRKRVA